jgi:hypothetical protein
MASWAVLLLGLLFSTLVVSGDPSLPEHQPEILKDSKTKVVYYLESDRRHIAAISPEGKLLWCCEVASKQMHESIRSFNFEEEGYGIAKGEQCIQVIIDLGTDADPTALGGEMKFLRKKDGSVATTVVE